MHAIQLHAFGPPENLVLDELPDLQPGPGQVRIAVEASGVHLLDTTIRRGEPGPLPPPELPTIPGREVAGVVDAVGPDADRTWLGRRVVAHLGLVPGGYAEQAVTAVDKLFQVPDHVSFPDAVAAVGTGRTALGVVELRASHRGRRGPGAVGRRWAGLVAGAVGAGGRCDGGRGRSRRTHRDASGALARTSSSTTPNLAGTRRSARRPAASAWSTTGWAARSGDSLEVSGPAADWSCSASRPARRPSIATEALIGRGISAGWSLGARMVALPGGIPGLAGRALEKVVSGEWRPLVSTYPLSDAGRAHADLEGRRALGKVVLLPGHR